MAYAPGFGPGFAEGWGGAESMGLGGEGAGWSAEYGWGTWSPAARAFLTKAQRFGMRPEQQSALFGFLQSPQGRTWVESLTPEQVDYMTSQQQVGAGPALPFLGAGWPGMPTGLKPSPQAPWGYGSPFEQPAGGGGYQPSAGAGMYQPSTGVGGYGAEQPPLTSDYIASIEGGRLRREQKFLAEQYPEEWGAITAKLPYQDFGEQFGEHAVNIGQEYLFALGRMPEYEELIKRATVEATPTSIWETEIGKLPSFGMQQYFKGQRTPITQAYQAKLEAEEKAVPPKIQPTELERGATFGSFLEQYPFWEEWIQIPRRQRGEYPAQYRPQTRWLGY